MGRGGLNNASRWMIANIALDDALILPHRANPTGLNFRERQVAIHASAANGSFTVAVCDCGPGISQSDQARIFGEFQQADNSSTRRKGGTGLGLSIAKRIIEMHNGRIWVQSALGKGSTFFFSLPVRVHQGEGTS